MTGRLCPMMRWKIRYEATGRVIWVSAATRREVEEAAALFTPILGDISLACAIKRALWH